MHPSRQGTLAHVVTARDLSQTAIDMLVMKCCLQSGCDIMHCCSLQRCPILNATNYIKRIAIAAAAAHSHAVPAIILIAILRTLSTAGSPIADAANAVDAVTAAASAGAQNKLPFSDIAIDIVRTGSGDPIAATAPSAIAATLDAIANIASTNTPLSASGAATLRQSLALYNTAPRSLAGTSQPGDGDPVVENVTGWRRITKSVASAAAATDPSVMASTLISIRLNYSTVCCTQEWDTSRFCCAVTVSFVGEGGDCTRSHAPNAPLEHLPHRVGRAHRARKIPPLCNPGLQRWPTQLTITSARTPL
jgi:hypothetical protein